MTGISKAFLKSPRYQRMIQKFSSISPYQKAIVDTALLDEKFADQNMRRDMQAMAVAADAINKDRSLSTKEKMHELEKQSLGLRTSLYKDKLALARERLGRGEEALARGAGRLGLEKDIYDYNQDQQRMGTYISAANLPIAGYLGYEQMQADQDEAEAIKEFRKKMMLGE